MSKNSKRNQIIKMFTDLGYTNNQAIGLVANFQAESSFNTRAHNSKDPGAKGSQGLAQWNGARLDKLQSMYGDGWDKLENQVAFVDWELKNTHKSVGNKLRNTNSFEEATHLITTEYEIPADRYNKAKDRIKIAKGYTDVIPEDYDPTVWDNTQTGTQLGVKDYIKKRVEVNDPRFNYETNMGIISSAPDLPDEDKSEIAKISIIQKQLSEIQEQMSTPQVQQAPEPIVQQPKPTTHRSENYAYLSNSDLFSIQPEIPQLQSGGRFKNRF